MKHIVVTGGAGFIGSNLVEFLAAQECRITIIDNLSTGNMSNLGSLPDSPDIEFVEGDITDSDLLARVFQNKDYIFHLAAISSVPMSIADPVRTHIVNADGTLNVLQAARDAQVKKVVYASSSAVYGDAPELPKREDMPSVPMSPYAVSKLTGENYCQVFTHVYGLPTVSLRYFNVYGKNQSPDSQYAAVIPKFLSIIAAGNAPVIFGDGEQTRDFVYIKDVAAVNWLAAISDAAGVYNIGSGETNTINQLTEMMLRLLHSDKQPSYQEERTGDIKHSSADISRARGFGFEPKYSLEQGVSELIQPFLT